MSLFPDIKWTFSVSHGSEAISVPHLWQIPKPKLTTQETLDVTWAAEAYRSSGMLPVHSLWRDFSKWTQSYCTCSDWTFTAQWKWMCVPPLSNRQGNNLNSFNKESFFCDLVLSVMWNYRSFNLLLLFPQSRSRIVVCKPHFMKHWFSVGVLQINSSFTVIANLSVSKLTTLKLILSLEAPWTGFWVK